MVNVLKKIVSPFYDFEKEPGQEQDVEQPATPVTSPATPALRAPFKSTSVKPQIDEAVRKQLVDDIEAAISEPLSNFLGLLDSMKDLQMDDQTRFKAAFTAFQKQTKGSVDTLLNGVQTQLDTLDTSVVQFEKELKNAQKDIDLKRKQAEDAQEKTAQLRNQIAELTAQQSQLLAEASQDEQTLNTQQGVFANTVESVRADLNQQASLIGSYLSDTITPPSTKSRKRT